MSTSLRNLVLVLVLTLVSTHGVYAQWTNVAPGLIPSASNLGGGSIVYKQGVVWAGMREIFISTDDGLNWQQRSTPLNSIDYVRNLDAYDDSTALLASNEGDTWITTDQGNSWRKLRNTGSAFAARFLGSPRNIVIAGGSTGLLDVTTDGGQTWKSTKIGTFVPFVVPLLGGTAYALVATIASKTASRVMLTTDYGMTWTAAKDTAGFDSYSFAVDPCSPERLYIANEDAGNPGSTNGISEIYVSSNSGDTWTTTYARSGKDLVGSIALASNSVYVQRLADGILRSTDFGNTWVDVGGPSMIFDSRLLCAVTDNLVLAGDAQGNIWRTTNAGGDSVHGTIRYHSITSTPDLLFNWDTLFSCDPPTFDTLFINSIFCQPPRIISVVIEGEHAQDFTLTSSVPQYLSGADTLAFRFMPRGNGERRANVRITFQDSTTIIVPMRGFGKGVTELTLATSNVSTDTLGAEVYIPINYESDGEMTGIAARLSFQSDQIEFVGAYDLLGVSVVVPGGDPKHQSLRFPPTIAQNGIIGHAAFRVYSGLDACVPVLFDSITILSQRPACAFVINPDMQAQICMPNDCVAIRVSDYLRYGTLPKLAVMQAGSDLVITSDANCGEVQIKIVNTLGVTESAHAYDLRADRPVRFSVASLPEGIYFIEVRSTIGRHVLKQIILH